MALLTVGGLAVAALVVWALTRTVQPAVNPSPSVTVPVTAQPSNTPPTSDTSGFTAAPSPATATAAAPQTPQTSPAADETATIARTSVSELRSKIDGGQVTVIDVRDKTAYMGGHIPGALNVPFAQMESQVSFLPKNKPIVTYCT